VKRTLITIFAVLWIASNVFAAEGPQPSPRLKDLSGIEGHWTCSGTTFEFMGVPAHKSAATMDITWDLDKFWLHVYYTESKTSENPAPVSFRSFWTWDARETKFVATAVDNYGGRLAETSAGWIGDKLTLAGDLHIGEQTIPLHEIWTKIGPSKIMHTGEGEVGGKWTKLDEEICTR